MDDWVFVDTCIWASFFSKPGSKEKHTIDVLLDHDRVAIVGPILGEVLLGFRRTDQADWVASRLRQSHYVDLHWDDWRWLLNLDVNLLLAVRCFHLRTCLSRRSPGESAHSFIRVIRILTSSLT